MMIELKENQLVFSFPEIHEQAQYFIKAIDVFVKKKCKKIYIKQ